MSDAQTTDERMIEAGIKQLMEHPEDAEYVRELYAPEQPRRHAAMARLVTAIFVAMETERAGDNRATQTTDWQPISDAPPLINEIAHYALPPRLGHHVGRCHTLPDGRWVVIKFASPGTEPESYFILPKPSLGIVTSPRSDRG